MILAYVPPDLASAPCSLEFQSMMDDTARDITYIVFMFSAPPHNDTTIAINPH